MSTVLLPGDNPAVIAELELLSINEVTMRSGESVSIIKSSRRLSCACFTANASLRLSTSPLLLAQTQAAQARC